MLIWAELCVVDNVYTHVYFQLHQSGANKCYCCQDHPYCHPFQRSVHATGRKWHKKEPWFEVTCSISLMQPVHNYFFISIIYSLL